MLGRCFFFFFLGADLRADQAVLTIRNHLTEEDKICYTLDYYHMVNNSYICPLYLFMYLK